MVFDTLTLQTSPETFLSIAIMVLLMIGVFARGSVAQTASTVTTLSALVLCVTIGLFFYHQPAVVNAFGGLYVSSPFVQFIKTLAALGGIAGLFMSAAYFAKEKAWRFEYPVVLLFAVLGMFVMLSAGNLMSLYIGLELQSLALYVLASFKRDTIKSSEAGLKYFILGALASGFILFGSSLLYGYTGTLSFDDIRIVISSQESPSILLTFGLVFVTAGMAFKISAVPFHMWTPDVYEGAPTPVTAFFAIVPKVVVLAVMMQLYAVVFAGAKEETRQILYVLSVASMVVGAVTAIMQTNIKRLLAYSSIGHMGYALIPLVVGTHTAFESMLLYLMIYMVSGVGIFGLLLSFRQNGVSVETVRDFAGISKHHPFFAMLMAVFLFSMAGIPPLAGFIGKLFVFNAAVMEGYYILAIIGVLSSVIAAFYYLRVIKVMYFDEGMHDETVIDFTMPVKAMTAFAGVVTLFLIVQPDVFIRYAESALAAFRP